MHDRVFIGNHGVYSAGIGVPGFLVKPIDVDKIFMVVND